MQPKNTKARPARDALKWDFWSSECQSCSTALLVLVSDICLMTGVPCDLCPGAAVGSFPSYTAESDITSITLVIVTCKHFLNCPVFEEETGLLLGIFFQVVFLRLHFEKKKN